MPKTTFASRVSLVGEFPERDDPVAQRLLCAKPDDAHPDYSRETFETLLGMSFATVHTVELSSGMRTLYHALP